MNRDAHCGSPACACTHDGECYRGWLDRRDDEHGEHAVPCPTCRPAQRRVTQLAPDRVAMGARLRERGAGKQWTGQ